MSGETSTPASADLNFPRLVTFAAQHPDLAKLVHRLQLQVPPFMDFDRPVGDRMKYLLRQKHVTWISAGFLIGSAPLNGANVIIVGCYG